MSTVTEQDLEHHLVTATTDSVGSNIPATAQDPGAGSERVAEALREGFTDATRLSLAGSAVFLLLGLGGALAVRRKSLPVDRPGRPPRQG